MKEVKLFPERPDIWLADLESDCREITEEKDAAALLAEVVAETGSAVEGVEVVAEELEDVIDPDEPLYGLKERLMNLGLDEQSMNIIVERLVEANTKVKKGLEERQVNLEQKM